MLQMLRLNSSRHRYYEVTGGSQVLISLYHVFLVVCLLIVGHPPSASSTWLWISLSLSHHPRHHRRYPVVLVVVVVVAGLFVYRSKVPPCHPLAARPLPHRPLAPPSFHGLFVASSHLLAFFPCLVTRPPFSDLPLSSSSSSSPARPPLRHLISSQPPTFDLTFTFRLHPRLHLFFFFFLRPAVTTIIYRRLPFSSRLDLAFTLDSLLDFASWTVLESQLLPLTDVDSPRPPPPPLLLLRLQSTLETVEYR
ncbi:hypothetical protein TRV_04862 [Trichophyton verrucosum HKI 0517]|uniref:Uncharacterized protein n=1 Tax=Trichophyton verrucosum (strain HKI 0517) TaxID=663202 RepID=D4DCK7_TRIVH|nr:uncharacterized protein TRV_04862 [Trichophyton verrucosum HKI 0517]EFE40379.1 hypothetical protein TRV_04862 [Trichophyton verrucosum HKI 0517]